MKFFAKYFTVLLLPYIIMFFVNMYGFRYAFEAGLTAPHDATFIGGALIAALLVMDVAFIIWQIKKIISQYHAPESNEEI